VHDSISLGTDIVFEDGTMSCTPESIVSGVQWHALPGIATAEEISAALAKAATKKATDQAKADEAAAARLKEIARIKAEYPHLEQGSGYVVAGKNIRTELKRAFPAVKFSVRGKSYSGGCSIDVSWVDGPTSEQVKAILGKYAQGSFDGMIDCYEYSRAPWTEVFGGAQYVHGSRDFSDAFVAAAIKKVGAEYGAKETPSVEDFNQGRAWNASPISNAQGDHHWSWQALITRTASEMSA
jgi:hypothetical protein